MPILPADPIPLPFDFNNIDVVRALVLRIAGGASTADFAADAEMPVEEFEAALWWTLNRLLGLTFDHIESPPEDGALVVSGEGFDAVQLEWLHAQFRSALPEGTAIIATNFPVDMQVIGPLTDDHVLLVTGEDCDADTLDELADQFNQFFPDQSTIIANYPIDVETLERSQVKALMEYCADILTLPPDEVLTGFLPEPENVLTDLHNLANRYMDALMRVTPGSGPRSDVAIEVTSVGNRWRLRFIEKTDGAGHVMQEWEEDTAEELTARVTSLVLSVEAMPIPVDMPTA
jgi:hypothetical protein